MIKQGKSLSPEAHQAVLELKKQIVMPSMAGVLFFCSSKYNLNQLAEELNQAFDCPVTGCTSSGEICGNYQKDGIVGISFSSEAFDILPLPIDQLASFDVADVARLNSLIGTWKGTLESARGGSTFAICLLDGLSIMEEIFLGKISSLLKDFPIIGGSAGDDLAFKETHVFCNKKFSTNSGVLFLVNTSLAFETFRFQHFMPSEKDMVITSADAAKRVVYEIDGSPAAEEYARILGLPQTELTPQVFSTHPVMLQIGESWYVRSIQKVNPDGSLTFFCAIDEGLPMTIADGVGFVDTLQEQINGLSKRYESIDLTIGFDCILRKLEIEEKGLQREVEDAISGVNFVGFSTYGEQFNNIHVNQTLTGVIIGKRST